MCAHGAETALERLDGVADAEVLSLDTGETLILAETNRSFDPAQIGTAITAAGFSGDKVVVVVKGTLKRVEDSLALRVPGFGKLLLLEGEGVLDELKKQGNDADVSVSGVFHAPSGNEAPSVTVEEVH